MVIGSVQLGTSFSHLLLHPWIISLKKQCCRVYLVSIPLILLFLLWCVTVNQTAADDIAALIAEHQRRLQETPESPDMAVEDFDRGLIHYQKALELNPNLTTAHYGLGILYSGKRQFKKAIPAYKKALSLEPNATQIYVKLGDAYAEIYQFSAAIPSYQKAVELEPNWAEAYYQLGTI